MDTNELYQKLENRRRELNLTQGQLGEMILGTPSTSILQNIRRGSAPSADRLAALCDALQLEFYVGPKRSPVVARQDDDTDLVDHFDLQVSAGAGSSSVATPIEPAPFSARWLRKHSLKASDLAILEVMGDSMEPILFQGDTILVDKRKSRAVSGKMYVVVRRDSVQVKWVMVNRKSLKLVSENDLYPPERVDPHEAPDFYRVRWFGHFLDSSAAGRDRQQQEPTQ